MNDPTSPARKRAAAGRVAHFFKEIVRGGELYAIGDGDGVITMDDAFGQEVVPLWPTLEDAQLECEPNTPERPMRYDLETFVGHNLDRIAEQDMGIAVFPVGTRIAISLTVEGFKSKVGAEARKQNHAGLAQLYGKPATPLP